MTGVAQGFGREFGRGPASRRAGMSAAAAGSLCVLACAALLALVPAAGRSDPLAPSRPVPAASGALDEGGPRCRGAGWPYASCGRDAEAPMRRVRVIAIGASADARPR